MSDLVLKTIGIHPVTDALELHALIDALHSYGLDGLARVRPREGYHEVVVPGDSSFKALCALVMYVLKLMYSEALLMLNASKGKGVGNYLKLLQRVMPVVKECVAKGEVTDELNGLLTALIKHFTESHPVTLNSAFMVKSKCVESVDTKDELIRLLTRDNDVKEGIPVEVKRVIPVLPAIGKFHYVDSEVKSWGSYEFDTICGRLVRGGLQLALTYPVRVGEGNFHVGVSLLMPSDEVSAQDLWKAQAMLRTFRHRWVRGNMSWGRAHSVFMVLDAFRISRGVSEDAMGYLAEIELASTQGKWRSPYDADRLRMLYLANSEYAGFAWYSKGVTVVFHSVMPTHPVLRLANVLEELGGSVDWLVDDLIMRYYKIVTAGAQSLNYPFTMRIVKALVEGSIESLYLALRNASVTSFERKEPLINDAYQLERLVASLELTSTAKPKT